ncbi:copia LTR rider [Trifolium medium]|uniref:Copia LTR rider n=1 Tax=Trifolium medium TaxID=97028 RepID=A0A392LZJ2_9FABA|nr:copia LTR rider [Trifolium medium]
MQGVSGDYESVHVQNASVHGANQYFETLEPKEGGVVRLGNNKACKVQGHVSGRGLVELAKQDLKTLMEVWSGRSTDYSNLKIFGALAFAHVKQDKLDARAVKCAFIGYLEDLDTSSEMGVQKIQFEVEPSIDEGEEEDQTLVPDESGSQTTAPDYQLTRDREKRVITPPNRYDYADIICYALNAAEEVQDSEPKTFMEALESSESKD